jgi:hypothetical protein
LRRGNGAGRLGTKPAGDRRLQLEVAGEVDLNLGLRAAGRVLLGTEINAAADILADFDRRTVAGIGATDGEPVETQRTARGVERVETAIAAASTLPVSASPSLN